MPESSPISATCAQIVGIQGMSGLWGSKRAYIYNSDNRFFKVSLVGMLLNRCTVFLNRALSAIFFSGLNAKAIYRFIVRSCLPVDAKSFPYFHHVIE